MQSGKGRFDLVPLEALQRVAQLYERGADKYGDRNWELGQPLSRCFSSLLRHAMQAKAGHFDEDHLAAVVFNAFAIMTFLERRDELPAEIFDMDWDEEPLDDGPTCWIAEWRPVVSPVVADAVEATIRAYADLSDLARYSYPTRFTTGLDGVTVDNEVNKSARPILIGDRVRIVYPLSEDWHGKLGEVTRVHIWENDDTTYIVSLEDESRSGGFSREELELP